MILQIHFTCKDNVALGMGTRDRLIVGMIAEMLAMEVLLEAAANRERLQAVTGRQIFVPQAKDALCGFAIDRQRFR